jgi:hypothetical protein
MQPDFNSSSSLVIEIRVGDRWQIYRRLQELEISCKCCAHQPLKVEVANGLALIQIWSVTRQFDAPRVENIELLNRCWKQVYFNSDRG